MAKRSSNWTFEEISMLADFVRINKHSLVGTRSKATANVEKVKQHYWELASRVLVENGCHSRPWKKIRKKWQKVCSLARSYHRDMSRTGGGKKPVANKIFDKVLEALAPVAKDGILMQEEGESNPIPTPTASATTTEAAFDFLTNAIIEGSSFDAAEDSEENAVEEEVVEDDIQLEDEDTSQITKTPSLSQKSLDKKPTLMEIEIERVQLERERMEVDKEHLEVFRQISGSLQEISQNFQVFINTLKLKNPEENEA